ncbi:unnamed protein product [Triticum turgidum subsp. durum]|uniref:F-box domain-containing protein n=1 Tax=Triticum turgidum subsp. durum TaxID=4567 RepID=A0A9R0Z0S8_TRITD|nr:unnamed protein product [Triticum turgidum subsp. durum]
MEALPDDIVVEILVRVRGVAALFRCAATCNRWRRLIADASFLFRLWPEGVPHSSFLLGFLVTQLSREERPARSISAPAPSFALAPWSPLGDRYRFLGHYIHGLTKDGRLHTVPLTARRGLLLNHIVELVYPNNMTTEGSFSLALCDPLAGVGRELPPLKYNGKFTMVGYTILTDLDCCSDKRRWPIYEVSFKVLIISVDEGQPGYNLHVFMPAEWSWSTPRQFFGTLEHGVHVAPQQANAVVCQGAAHWLFRRTSSFYTLSVCAKTAHMSLTRLPITPYQIDLNLYSEPMLSVTNDGMLSLLRLYRKFTMLEIWTCQGDYKSEDDNVDRWYRTKMIKLKRPTQIKIDLVRCVCIGEMSGKLLVNDNQGCVYIADLQTGAMETVTEWFRNSVQSAIPFEMDWPAYFMSQLAGGRIKRTKLGGAIQKIAKSFWGLVVVSVIFGLIAMRWAWA